VQVKHFDDLKSGQIVANLEKISANILKLHLPPFEGYRQLHFVSLQQRPLT